MKTDGMPPDGPIAQWKSKEPGTASADLSVFDTPPTVLSRHTLCCRARVAQVASEASFELNDNTSHQDIVNAIKDGLGQFPDYETNPVTVDLIRRGRQHGIRMSQRSLGGVVTTSETLFPNKT